MGQDAGEAVLGDVIFGRHELVAELDGFAEELLVVVHHEQTLAGRILRIEQADVGLGIADAEVVAQHAVVEQQLHIVRLELQTVGALSAQVGILRVHP